MRLKALISALVMALVAAPSALAVGSAQAVYGGPAGVSQEQVETVSSSGALPFTGLDLILLGGGGALLLVTGLALYLISRPRASA